MPPASSLLGRLGPTVGGGSHVDTSRAKYRMAGLWRSQLEGGQVGGIPGAGLVRDGRFSTADIRDQPGFRPAGRDRCSPHELQRWEADQYRFPPYQYRDHNLLWTRKGAARRPNVHEREATQRSIS